MLEIIVPRWEGRTVVVAATGPSLTRAQCEACAGLPAIAVNDAYRLMPWATVMYACDSAWWDVHRGCPDFAGEKWSSHGGAASNDKLRAARKYGLRLVAGEHQAKECAFSTHPAKIVLGANSGFQAINLAMLLGGLRVRILLLGIDMKLADNGRRHFFGDHPKPLRNASDYRKTFLPNFESAAKRLPAGVSIVNCTPGSDLRCFPMMRLDEALSEAEAA